MGRDRNATADLIPVAFITAVYLAAGYFAGIVLGWPVEIELVESFVWVGALLLVLLFLAALAAVFVLSLTSLVRWLRRRSGRPAEIPSWTEMRRLLTRDRLTAFFAVLFLYVVMIAVYVGFKRAIPAVHPFSWDVAFMELDRALHLGRHPWELLHPLLAHPWITGILDGFYYLWFSVTILCMAGFIAVRDRTLRIRFFVALWLSHIFLGTVLAYLFSSAGPVYYGAVTGLESPFEPLMSYLRGLGEERGLLAPYVQAELWKDYTSGTAELFKGGISAMPSVHVGLPVLFVFAGWKVNRAFGIAFLVFAILILLGSVHLGWHYAIDGYASALVVAAIWWVSGPLARLYRQRQGMVAEKLH